MTAPQMVCHLTDAFRNILGERPVVSAGGEPSIVGRTVLKWVALYTPVPWPKGLRTRPDADQEIRGTPPSAEFASDVVGLKAAAARFVAAAERGSLPHHFMFGRLSEAEWSRWAYLHMDHHLRQFGV